MAGTQQRGSAFICGLGQQGCDPVGHNLRQSDKAQAVEDIEGEVEHHHVLASVGQIRRHINHPEPDKGSHDRNPHDLEQQIADGDLALFNRRFGSGQRCHQAAAQIGAQREAQCNIKGNGARAGHGRNQQHHGEAGISHHGEHCAQQQLHEHVAADGGQQGTHNRCLQ